MTILFENSLPPFGTVNLRLEIFGRGLEILLTLEFGFETSLADPTEHRDIVGLEIWRDYGVLQ